jgi:hypothetical protein
MNKQLVMFIAAIILGGSAQALTDEYGGDYGGGYDGGGGGYDGGGYEAPPTPDYVLAEVTVIGRLMDELPAGTVLSLADVSTIDEVWTMSTVGDKPAIEKLKDPRKDVRALCAIGKVELASTTSLTDEVGRQDAVRALVGVNSMYWAARIVRGRFTGDTVPFGGMKEAIATAFTYADGGTEKWYVNPFISENAIATPGSLKPGDGVARDVPCKP